MAKVPKVAGHSAECKRQMLAKGVEHMEIGVRGSTGAVKQRETL